MEDKTVEPQIIQEPKKKKTFADYYQDPDYRARHVKYMMEKIPCSGHIT